MCMRGYPLPPSVPDTFEYQAVVTINMPDAEAAAGVGEYVADAIDAGALTLEEVYTAARQAFRFAMRAYARPWPGFGEDWR